MMNEAYYALEKPDSYGSARGLKRQTTEKWRDIHEFLAQQDAYTLHRDIRRRFPRRKTIALGIDELWQADIVDLSSLARANDNYRYLLTVIDVFSKFGRVAAMKSKNAASVTTAFREMIGLQGKRPVHLQTDKGTEFLNSTFQKLLSDNNIKHYTSENDDIKCAIIERLHRSLLAKLYRYFTHKNTSRYVDILQDLMRSYNETYHSSIKTAPILVDEHNESDVRDALYSKKPKLQRPHLKVGDTVRISGTKRAFAKGYRDKWTEEVFKVVKIYNTKPITYGLTDYSDEPIKGKFYSVELQKVTKEVFRIEKVLRTRKRAGKTEYYVKWLGYSDKFNSWTDHINA
jgi:transposase InsO family protein